MGDDGDGPWVAASAKTGRDRRLHSNRHCHALEMATTVREAGPAELDELDECGRIDCGGEPKNTGDLSTFKAALDAEPEPFTDA
jgi:hypothetical protein